MSKQNDNPDKQVREIYERVNCGYLTLSKGVLIGGGKISVTDLLVGCRNLQCGPQHGCDFLDKGECGYRSAQVDPKCLYSDWPEEPSLPSE